MDGGTRVFAVLGHPVAHTLSPPMQNAAFEAAGLNAVFVALDVAPVRLGAALEGLRAAGVSGLNLTLPLKEAAFARLAGATPEALAAGAANTLRPSDGGWEGHATDGPGFGDWLDEVGLDPRGARVLLLGAGGAARCVAPVLLARGVASLDVASRGGPRAEALTAALAGTAAPGTRIRARALDGPAPGAGAWDLLVRAIAAERVEAPEERLWLGLEPNAPVLDLNYGARAEAVRARALRDGRPMRDGLGLLLHQGARSFTYWTGLPAPIEAMRSAIGM